MLNVFIILLRSDDERREVLNANELKVLEEAIFEVLTRIDIELNCAKAGKFLTL